jgi:hypothetical protein
MWIRSMAARNEPQPVYAADPRDAWNQVFFLLFTRTIDSRVMAPRTPVFSAGDERLSLTDDRIVRIESGDRAIDPLYPSWLWMGSLNFDFDRNGSFHILREPRFSMFVAALESVRRTAASRPPLARALMQADLWSAYDMLHTIMAPGRPKPRVDRLVSARNLHAGGVAALKMGLEDFKALREHWRTSSQPRSH